MWTNFQNTFTTKVLHNIRLTASFPEQPG